MKRRIRLRGLMLLIALVALALGAYRILTTREPVVYVQGDVRSPGKIMVVAGMTALDALKAAGNPTSAASSVNIRLVRPATPGACCEQVLPVNLSSIVNGADPTTNHQIVPGDRLVVYRDNKAAESRKASISKGREKTSPQAR